MPRKIILFTRITDEKEWNTWAEIISVTESGNELYLNQQNISLLVRNGNALLGQIDDFGAYERRRENGLVNRAQEFIKKLYSAIMNEESPETVIAIHFGRGKPYDHMLKPWLDFFGKGDLNDSIKRAVNFLEENLNVKGKPVLTAYSIGSDKEKDIEGFIRNEVLSGLSAYYNWLRIDVNAVFGEVKHDITRLFLSMDVTLQDLDEKQADLEKASAPLKLLQTQEEGYYKKKIDKLKDSVSKILDEYRNCPAWKRLLQVSGFRTLDSIDQGSSIWQFMNKMDNLSKKDVKNIDLDLVSEILSFPPSSTTEVRSFHDWFIALDEALDKLKEEISELQRNRPI